MFNSSSVKCLHIKHRFGNISDPLTIRLKIQVLIGLELFHFLNEMSLVRSAFASNSFDLLGWDNIFLNIEALMTIFLMKIMKIKQCALSLHFQTTFRCFWENAVVG